jgi:thymidylate synthase
MSMSYEELLVYVMQNGDRREDRTGVGTVSVFGAQLAYSLSNGFPLITSKRVYWKGVVEELLWFIRGSTNNNDLVEKGVHIWDEWAKPDGDLGPIYGKQWRAWSGGIRRTPHGLGVHEREVVVDQLAQVIEQIKRDPFSRRHIVSAWNVAELDQMALAPCHVMFQFYVRESSHGRYLDCQLYQRSADLFLGVPFNIASYALLTCMVAYLVDMKPGCFYHSLGDAHIYSNHMEQVTEQLSRQPHRPHPTLKINPDGREIKSIDDFQADDFLLIGYNPYPAIKAPVAV